jgi:vitamin B12 transporter
MKKEKKVWALTLLAFWWLSPKTMNAQQQDSVRTLDEVTITATRIEQPVIQVPRSVSILTREIIERSVYNSVGDLLTAEAGVYVVGSNQTPGTNQSIFMRGANSNQVVVMINGLRINDPSSPNSSIDLSEISLTDVEKIEVIRGAHSTLYGGSAIGGAINIITRKGGRDGFHGTGTIQGGTFGNGSFAGNGNLSLNYKATNGWYVNGSVFVQQVKGLNATEDTIATTDYKTSDKDNFRKNDVYAKAGYMSGPWDIFVAAKRSNQRADIDDGAYNDDDNAFLEFDRSLFEYGMSFKAGDRWKLGVAGSYSTSTRLLQNDSSKISNSGDYDHSFYEATYNGRIISNELSTNYSKGSMNVVLGAGHYSEKMDFQTFYFSNAFGFPFELKTNYDSINSSATTLYLFGQVSYNVQDFNIKAGARFNTHSLAGDFFTFELSPSYRFANTLVYASASTGYNAPSLYQLYDPTPAFDERITRGNRKLEAERSVSLEVGIKKEFNNGSYVTVSAYNSQIKDDIEYVLLWNKEVPVNELDGFDYIGDTYLNISKQRISGAEISGRINAGKFYLLGNVSLMKGKITLSPEDISQDETNSHHVQLYSYGTFATKDVTVNTLTRRPRMTAYSELGFRVIPSLTIYGIYRIAGSRDDVEYDYTLGPYGALGNKNVNRYNLIDFGVNYSISDVIAVNAKIENVTNENYREINGFTTRGRSGYFKLIVKW